MISLHAPPAATETNGQHEGAEEPQNSVEPEEDEDTFAHLHDSDLVPLRRLQMGLFDVSSRHQVQVVPQLIHRAKSACTGSNRSPLTFHLPLLCRRSAGRASGWSRCPVRSPVTLHSRSAPAHLFQCHTSLVQRRQSPWEADRELRAPPRCSRTPTSSGK